MPRPTAAKSFVQAASLFAALGDPNRLQLVARLSSEGPRSISALAKDEAISRQAITKHLRSLSEAGFIRSRRQGRERIYEFVPDRLSDAHSYLDSISRHWDAALDRLKHLVED